MCIRDRTYDEKNEVYRGSARSVESIPLNQIFDDLKEHFVQYGGHALAGGFQAVSYTHLDVYKRQISRRCHRF